VLDQLFFGIDGGGTKTAAWLGSRSPTETGALRVVGRGASACFSETADFDSLALGYSPQRCRMRRAAKTNALSSLPAPHLCGESNVILVE
jgi:hypothetical protein